VLVVVVKSVESVAAPRCIRFAVSTTKTIFGAYVFMNASGSICANAGADGAARRATTAAQRATKRE
jgi:hypothetical protein